MIYIFLGHGWTVLLIRTRIGCKLNGSEEMMSWWTNLWPYLCRKKYYGPIPSNSFLSKIKKIIAHLPCGDQKSLSKTITLWCFEMFRDCVRVLVGARVPLRCLEIVLGSAKWLSWIGFGGSFIWSGVRFKKYIQSKLDRFFGNKEWKRIFPLAIQVFLERWVQIINLF